MPVNNLRIPLKGGGKYKITILASAPAKVNLNLTYI